MDNNAPSTALAKKARHQKPKAWQPIFLDALREEPNVSRACRIAGISRRYAHMVRHEDPEFAAAWDEAVDASLDALEAAAFRRAHETSDTLAIFLLKCHRPERYGQSPDQNAPVTIVIHSDWKP